jgi:hypothetical protein
MSMLNRSGRITPPRLDSSDDEPPDAESSLPGIRALFPRLEELKVAGPERIRDEGHCLSLLREDAPKVILVSNDNQRLCVDRSILSMYR